MTGDLPTEIRVTALLRQCATRGVPAYVTHKGAPAAGTVAVKVVIRGKGCRLFNQSRDMDGHIGWLDIYEGNIVDEPRADQYIQRAVERDPDVWVIEVEDTSGQNPFEGKVF